MRRLFLLLILTSSFFVGGLVRAHDCAEFSGGDLNGDDLLVTLSKFPGQQLSANWSPTDLISIPSPGKNQKMRLRKEAAIAFAQMEAEALKQKIEFKIRSAYRAFERQCTLFKAASKKAEGAAFVAYPGRSEHQLGTTVDIGELTFDFRKTKAFHWLMLHAHEYGFTMSYGESEHEHPEPENPETGYAFEPWHWRYIGVRAATDRWASSLTLIYFLMIHQHADQELSARLDH